jgi:hypothetical protein
MCDYYTSTRSGQGTSCIYSTISTLNKHVHIQNHVHAGRLRVGRIVSLFVITYKRKAVGPTYKGTVLFMKVLQHNVMPERVDNFYVCAKNSTTIDKFVRVEDFCTLLAEVDSRSGNPNEVNLVPVAHAFPVSWVQSEG